ncbi:MAG: UbiA family prenyltransferase [Flavobacteriales bacterium]|nr:UbiA family prenyltransferase [Flavobacteriales bacterium]
MFRRLLITGSFNAFNQVLEVRRDGLMKRTGDRPLVRGTLSEDRGRSCGFSCGRYITLMLWLQFRGTHGHSWVHFHVHVCGALRR